MLALRRAQRHVSISMGPHAARLPRFVARAYAWRIERRILGEEGERGAIAASCSNLLGRSFSLNCIYILH